MDYDTTTIPEGYDTARNVPPERMRLWLDAVANHVGDRSVESVLDLGCGTGRFSGALAERFSARVAAVDPSHKMLARARAKGATGVRYLEGAGEAIPLDANSTDLVFVSMVFHHFRDPKRVLNECHRVLRAGGILFIRNATTDLAATYPYVPFFRGTAELLQQCMPSRTDVRAMAEEAQFRVVSLEVVVQQLTPSYAAFGDKLAAGGDSILTQLSPDDFAAGLRAVRAHAARVDPVIVEETVDVFVFEKRTPVRPHN